MGIELLGTIGTLLILYSFTRNDVLKIRFINSLGAIFFVVYGLLKGATSVWILNIIMVFVNAYKISKERKENE